MTQAQHLLRTLGVAAITIGIGSAALAQSTSASSTGSPSYAAGNSYVGISAGRSDFSTGNGTGAFGADKRDSSYNFALGSFFSGNVGAELGYTHFGTIQRGGGTTRAEGIHLSAIGRMPLST
jgi:OmpA-OmpF porin, OOP family